MKYPRANSNSRGYNYRWQQARLVFLSRPENATCHYCREAGRLTPAVLVDHNPAHRGNMESFWNEATWFPSCKACHDGLCNERDRSGTVRGATTDGRPLDPSHHWNK